MVFLSRSASARADQREPDLSFILSITVAIVMALIGGYVPPWWWWWLSLPCP